MRFIRGLLAGILTIGGLTYAAVRWFFRRSLPQVDGTLSVAGLSAPVEIIRDRWGVPHIYGQSVDDVLFGQGYVHAQDRLWQMELNRRIGHGRLAEIFGPVALGTDQFLRTLGFGRAAEQVLGTLDADSLGALESYARGVNAYLHDHVQRLPPEFALLRFRPEPWRPVDSVVYSIVMAWALSCNWDSEVMNAALIGKVGAERAERLRGDYPAGNPIILPQQTYASLAESVLAQFREAETKLALGGLGGMSNNWVVDGTKSVTGLPLLANDPHLILQMPSIWYENHLVAPDLEVTGVSFPGAPHVILGHNRDIAWGFTNACPDVQDLYVEKFNPEDSTQYEFEGRWEQARIVQEQIRVRGEPGPRTFEVVITRHGPIINRLTPLTDGRQPALALRWVVYEENHTIRAIARINRAANWEAFCQALRDWHVPSQNMVYADRSGNIGYYMPGKIPIRAKGMGVTPVPGWSGEYEWSGWVGHEDLPHVLNPAQHYIATANNQVVGHEYPHFLTGETLNGYRARRIAQLLNEKDRLSADDFARMQVDLYCEPAKTFSQFLLSIQPKDELARRALEVLRSWDYRLTHDSVAGALYALTQHFALRRVFEPWLGELMPYYMGVGFHPLLAPMLGGYLDRSLVTLQRVLLDDESHWFKDAQNHPLSRHDVLAGALDDAIGYLRQAVGGDLSNWTWGRIHRAGFNHALGVRKPLDWIFNRGPYPYGGDTNTVWQAAFVPQLPLNTNGGTASWRQIIDVSDWDASRAVHTTGQSGHPASKHYDDMIPMWLRGQYHPMLWTRERVEAHAEAHLTLEPQE